MLDVVPFPDASPIAAPGYASQAVISFKSFNLCMWMQRDRVALLDSSNKIPWHCLVELARPN
jgi:hypothetical protein